MSDFFPFTLHFSDEEICQLNGGLSRMRKYTDTLGEDDTN